MKITLKKFDVLDDNVRDVTEILSESYEFNERSETRRTIILHTHKPITANEEAAIRAYAAGNYHPIIIEK